MTAQVLFFSDFSEKDPHLNAVEPYTETTYWNLQNLKTIIIWPFAIWVISMFLLLFPLLCYYHHYYYNFVCTIYSNFEYVFCIF